MQTRIEEVLANEKLVKELNVPTNILQERYLSDINITLALIFDELRELKSQVVSQSELHHCKCEQSEDN